ncbi:MAG: hypothetical protein WBF93_13625 [Pirellulales bacterium]|nr:hypothetical protein [Pirellulales bacterium]
MPRYLALGDSMSIDDDTGVESGGAVNQFHRWLGDGWELDDRTCDGGRMEHVPIDVSGDVITLTIGGNDLLGNKEKYLQQGLSGYANEHLRLLQKIRATNPVSLLIVGDIYHPDGQLTEQEHEAFSVANRLIHSNCAKVGAKLATIYDVFRGNEAEYLCLQIEPTHKGATAIAGLFRALYEARDKGIGFSI